MSKRTQHYFTYIEHAMWKMGVEHWLETVAKSLANELRSLYEIEEPLIYYCHPMKVDGCERGGVIYCEESTNDRH